GLDRRRVARLLARRQDRHRAHGRQDRPRDRERACRWGAPRAEAAGAGGHHEKAGDAMTTPPIPPDFLLAPPPRPPGPGAPAAADRLLEAAERALARAEPTSAVQPRVAGASLLEARALVKIYKGRRVVNDVSARLEQGEIVGLLGPNGAGKTTTFYMITGLI